MPSIHGQSVLILGGSSGIGFAVAALCLAESMSVHIASSNPDRLAAAASRLKQSHPDGKITTHVCRLGGDDNEAALQATLDAATDNGNDKLDHIVLTAGDANVLPLAQTTQSHLETQTSLRVIAPILLAKLAPAYLRPSHTSSLILTGGAVAEKPQRGYTYPSFFAGGLHPFVRALAVEFAAKRLRVNMVSPGATETEMWGSFGEEVREGIKRGVVEGALLGKVGAPEEVAEAYGYLMRDGNATGACVRTNGGVDCQ